MNIAKIKPEHNWHDYFISILDKVVAGANNKPCACSAQELESLHVLSARRAERQNDHRFIGYIRAKDEAALEREIQLLQQYASEHNLEITQIFHDLGAPQSGLSHALTALEDADGLIVRHLDTFIADAEHRMRRLRPILHSFCCRDSKHLISIQEGINTGTVPGQRNAHELLNEAKEA